MGYQTVVYLKIIYTAGRCYDNAYFVLLVTTCMVTLTFRLIRIRGFTSIHYWSLRTCIYKSSQGPLWSRPNGP
jgi:hypothetical protein